MNIYQAMNPHCRALVLAGLMIVTLEAGAGGTPAGTQIDNQATVGYSIGGTPQPDVQSDGDAGTPGSQPTRFTVDNKVDVLVTESGGVVTPVAPGQTGAIVTFVVKNEGNATQDFALTIGQLPNGLQSTPGVGTGTYTDNFDAAGCSLQVTGPLPAGTTFAGPNIINALPPDATVTVQVVCSIPALLSNNDAAVVSLTATAHANDGTPALGSALTASSSNGVNTTDIVFADSAGTDDTNNEAKHSARDVYLVTAAQPTVTKTAQVICDPVHGNTPPLFYMPGAVVRWTITITNPSTSSASVTLTTLNDPMNPNTTLDPDLITGAGGTAGCEFATGGSGTPMSANGQSVKVTHSVGTRPLGGAGGPGTAYFTGVADGDGVTYSASNLQVQFSSVLPAGGTWSAGELKPGETVTIEFNVGIN